MAVYYILRKSFAGSLTPGNQNGFRNWHGSCGSFQREQP